MQKLPGVESAEVSLEQGLAILSLESDNRVTIEEIRERIRANGFTPKHADVRVAGRVIERDGRPALELPGPNHVYWLVEPPGDAAENIAIGARIVLEGRLPESTREGPVETLEVRPSGNRRR